MPALPELLAVDEAKRPGHTYIGTENVLRGFVYEGEGIAAGVLESLNVDLASVPDRPLSTLNTTRAAQETEATSVPDAPLASQHGGPYSGQSSCQRSG